MPADELFGKDDEEGEALDDYDNDEDEEDWGDGGYVPDTVPRRCTDLGCTVLGVVGFLLMAAILWDAWVLSRGPEDSYDPYMTETWDFRGEVCGQGINAGKGYLFLCAYQNKSALAAGLVNSSDSWYLDHKHAICVERCPRSNTTSQTCYIESDAAATIVMDTGTAVPESNATDDSGVKAVIVKDYPTRLLLGDFCEPDISAILQDTSTDASLLSKHASFQAFMSSAYPETAFSMSLVFFSDLAEAVMTVVQRHLKGMVAAAISAIVAAYLYTELLAKYALAIVWSSFALLIMGSGGFGLWKIYGNDPDLTVGRICCLVSGLSALALWLLSNTIDTAIACLMYSCKCISDHVSLKFKPLLELIMKGLCIAFVIAVFCLYLIGLLLHEGVAAHNKNRHTAGVTAEANEAQESLEQSGLLYRSWLTKVAAFASLWLGTWGWFVVDAGSKYLSVHIAGIWYFDGGPKETFEQHDGSKKNRPHDGPKTVWTLVRYHSGTVVLGGTLIGFMFPLQLVLYPIVCACRALGCCHGLVRCYLQNIEVLDKAVWCDVVLEGNSFWKAAKRAQEVVDAESDAESSLLNGATYIFQVIGALSIAFLGLLAAGAVDESTSDVDHNYTRIIAAAIALVVSWPIISMFDGVSDCILYFRTVDKKRAMRNAPMRGIEYACTPSWGPTCFMREGMA